MHIAVSLMTVMARPSCTTVRLFGASHCHVLPLRPECTVVVRSPRGGGGPSLGDRPLGGGGGPSSVGWGTTRGGGYLPTSLQGRRSPKPHTPEVLTQARPPDATQASTRQEC